MTMIGKALPCARIERPTSTPGAAVMSLTANTMSELNIKEGYELTLVAKAPESAACDVEITDAAAAASADTVAVTVKVMLTKDIADGLCTLSHQAAFMLQRDGRMPDVVHVSSIVFNAKLNEDFRTALMQLDAACMEANTLTFGHFQLNLTFWFLLWGLVQCPLHAAVLLALCFTVISQSLWAIKRGKLLGDLPKFVRVQRRWAKLYMDNKRDASLAGQPASVIAEECMAICAATAWSSNVLAFCSSLYRVLIV